MSEPVTETVTEAPQEGEAKTFDADYVAKIRQEAAKYRTEAKANSDAAKRLAEIEEANKSEAQKSADRIAALEREATAARAGELRFRVAAKYGIADEDADLFLTGTDDETLTRQAKRLVERESERKKQGNVAPNEGANNSAATGGTDRELARQLFQRGD